MTTVGYSHKQIYGGTFDFTGFDLYFINGDKIKKGRSEDAH